MTVQRGYFSLIQYCPDQFRSEAMNVGVVLLVPGHSPVTQFITNHARIRKVFGTQGADIERLKMAETAMAGRIELDGPRWRDVDDLKAFADTRANDLRLTEPRLTKVHDVYEELMRLFERLVASDLSTEHRRDPLELLPTVLSDTFLKLSKSERIWRPGRVEVPLIGRDVDVPFAYQNGAVNLIKPQIFRNDRYTKRKAGDLAFSGDLIQKYEGDDGHARRFVVVSTMESEESRQLISDHVAPLFKHYQIRLIRPAEAERFAAEVEKEAH